jgi:hypothetical protein
MLIGSQIEQARHPVAGDRPPRTPPRQARAQLGPRVAWSMRCSGSRWATGPRAGVGALLRCAAAQHRLRTTRWKSSRVSPAARGRLCFGPDRLRGRRRAVAAVVWRGYNSARPDGSDHPIAASWCATRLAVAWIGGPTRLRLARQLNAGSRSRGAV